MKPSDRAKPVRAKPSQPQGKRTPKTGGNPAGGPPGRVQGAGEVLSAGPFRAAVSGRQAAVLLAALGLAVYGNSFNVPFVYDGVHFIVENASLRQLNPLALTEGQSRLVSYYSFALNYAVGGYHVFGYHAVNLAIHVAAAWTLYGLVRRTLQSAPRCAARYANSAGGLALAIAALWLVHPLQTASVTYLYQRQESLMGLLYLLTLYCVLRGIQAVPAEGRLPAAASRIDRRWYALAVVCSLLGMGTKEVMVTAPLMTLWYDRAFWAASWREIWSRRRWLYAALGATAAIPFVFIWVHKEKYQSVGLMVSHVFTPTQYALSQPGVICHYLWLCIDPRGLCLDPNWPVAKTAVEIVPPAIFVGLLLGLTAWCVWRHPGWGFVGGWFFVILSPTSSVVPILDLAYDHRMYLSLASVFVLVVMGLCELWHWLAARSSDPLLRRAWVPPALAAVAVGVFGVETLMRNHDYRNVISIWEDTVAKAPHNPRAHYSLGRDLHELADGEEGMEEAALAEAEQALRLVPTYADARTLRATVLERIGSNTQGAARFCEAEAVLAELEGRLVEAQGSLDEAQQLHDRAAECFADAEQDLTWSIENGRNHNKADDWTNLGNLYARQFQSQRAIECYDRALALGLQCALAYKNRGSTYVLLKRMPEAVRDLRQAIALEDNHAGWYFMLAVALAAQDKADDGIRILQQAVARGAVSADVYGSLGALLAKKERWIEAEAAFRNGLAINPDSVPTLMNLADLLAKRGRKAEAGDCYRRVLAVNPRHEAARRLLEEVTK